MIRQPKRQYYTQNDEEPFILSFFGDLKGIFLDIGAWWGWEFSNTYRLVLNGWKGVCVEPSPDNLIELKDTHSDRSDIQIIEASVSTENGKAKLFQSKISGGSVNSLFRQHTEGRGGDITEVEVETITPEELLNRCIYKDFDFVSIDVENDDLGFEITRGLTELIKPKLFCIETVSNRPQVQSFLQDLGYGFIHQTPENLLMGLPK
jgi:FkbM family methyltransferase